VTALSRVVIHIPTPLRSYTQGAKEVYVQGATVAEVLKALESVHNGILAQVLSQDGEPHRFVNIYLGNENVRALNGLKTAVKSGDVISIIPAIAGGGGSHCKSELHSDTQGSCGSACRR
jgi:molybdopterin converting factor small subunit